MSIFALADLHLSFGVPNKEMDVFGDNWKNHPEKMALHWKERVSSEDLVLLPGDISWAKKIQDAEVDLEWIHDLPGTKVMIRGNHDYWWSAISKVRKILPPSIHAIQNDVFLWQDVAIAGSRMWDTDEYGFDGIIAEVDRILPIVEKEEDPQVREKIFLRELLRLEASLQAIPSHVSKRIAMVHYPPIGLDLAPSRISKLLEKYKIKTCVFGHLHNVVAEEDLFGEARGIRYVFTACDYLDFCPIKINL